MAFCHERIHGFGDTCGFTSGGDDATLRIPGIDRAKVALFESLNFANSCCGPSIRKFQDRPHIAAGPGSVIVNRIDPTQARTWFMLENLPVLSEKQAVC